MIAFRHTFLAAGAALALMVTGGAKAQTVSIGTNPQGSLTYATGSAIAKIVVEKANIKMRVVPQGGPTVTVPLLNAGELDFSIANAVAANFAVQGKVIFKKPNKNMRAVAVLFPLYSGFMVRADSPIKSIADLKGKRVTSDYLKQKIVGINAMAVLNTVGLSYGDVKKVPVPNGVRAVQDFETGNADAAYFSLSSGRTKQAHAATGGLRILGVEVSDAAIAKVKEIAPAATIIKIKPGKNFPGVKQPMGALMAPFVLNVSASVSDDVVYAVTKAIFENKAALAASVGPFKDFKPKDMSRDIGVPFHPGAKKFYAEKGM